MRAAIYCRVSTEDQEKEGTSLDSQREACLAKAKEPGYEVAEDFVLSETYSGLTLDRPKLSQLRQWVNDKEVDAVIAYTLDRLSRDPVHFIILQEELEKSGVELVLVTETVDSSDLGKLITYIKGYAAKLEAGKIRERTMRGIRERVKAGKMPSGRRARLYGYSYLPGKGVGEGVRYVNKAEAKWVKEIYHWLVEEGLTLNGITYRLRTLGVPTPSGKGFWIRSTVYKILTNPAYGGRTYCFTHVHKETDKHYKKNRKARKTSIEIKPYEEGIEVKGATPPLIEPELFEAAQARLRANKQQANRNGKVKYLLRGHIYCSRCRRKYWGYSRWHNGEPDMSRNRYYYCMGRRRIITPYKCDNEGYQADYLEGMVWEQVEKLLSQPGLVLAELERKRTEANQEGFLEQELNQVNKRLRTLDREQEELLQWALKGFPEETVISENEKINQQRSDLKQRRTELETKISQARKAEVDIEGIERFCELVQQNLKDFTFEDKRLALEALQVEVWVDGEKITIKGAIPVIEGDIESTLPCWKR